MSPDLKTVESLHGVEAPGVGRYAAYASDGMLDWSPGLVSVYGLPAAPRSHADFLNCVHPHDRSVITRAIDSLRSGGDSYSLSYRILRPDGEVRHISDKARVCRDVNGTMTELHGVQMDVTDLAKSAQFAAVPTPDDVRSKGITRHQIDEDLLEMGQHTSGLVIATIDYRAGTISLGAAAARLYGLGDCAMTVSREVLHAMFHPLDRHSLEGLIKASLDPDTGGRLVAEHRILLSDGTVRWLRIQKRNYFDTVDGLRQPVRGYLAATDITARKTAEADIRFTNRRLALAQEVAGIGVWDLDLVTGQCVWTPELYRLLDLDPATPASLQSFFDIIHRDDLDDVVLQFDAAVAQNSTYRSEFRIVRQNGEIRHIRGHGRVTDEEGGKALRMIGVNYDITDRKQADALLRENEARLRMILDETAALVGILKTDGTLLVANKLALDIGGVDRKEVIEKPFWEASWWTHSEEEVSRLKQAVADAAAGSHVRYDARVMAADGQLRTIDFSLSPVVNGEGEIALLVPSALDITERKNAERQLAESEARYRALFESINAGFCVVEVRLDAPDGRVDYRVIEANPAFYDQTGFPKEILGLWLREAAPALEEHWYTLYAGVVRTREPIRFEEHSELLGRWFEVFAFAIDAPQACRSAVLFHDISDRKRHEDHVGLLLKEVNHRAKNMLSLVNVIAKRTLASGAEGFIERFTDRISALAANQDVLVRSEWKSVDFEVLIRLQLAHFKDLFDDRIHVEGSAVQVFPEAAEKLGMALHELTTNAGKYGALSNEAGRVQISWAAQDHDGEEIFVLDWHETGGPQVDSPERSGFGSMISGSILESALKGTVDAVYAPSGLQWRLVCPLYSVTTAKGADIAPSTTGASVESTLPRILVVDDDPLLGLSISGTLEDEGFSIIGPATTCKSALALIAQGLPDFAILDVNLGKETSEPVASELARLGVPFLCASGYAKDQLPPAFRHAPFMAKPVHEDEILDLIRRHLTVSKAAQ